MNLVKCEWCNYHYDLDMFDSCPKCGGANSNPYKEKESIISTFLQKLRILNVKKILRAIFILIISILFIIFIISNLIGTKFTCRYYYLKNPEYIEIGEGKLYIDCLFLREDEFNEYGDYINVDFDLIVENVDNKEHDINIFLYQGENRYRISDIKIWNILYNGTSEYSLNEIFKFFGPSEGNGIVNISYDDNDDLFDFDKVEFEIDRKSYIFDLISSKHTYDEYKSFEEVDYNVLDKVFFGDGNYIYINDLSISNDLTTFIEFYISSIIENNDFNNLKIFLKTDEGSFHRILSAYDKYNLNDILKDNIDNKYLRYEVHAFDRNFVSLIFDIDGEFYEVPISPIKNSLF